jgi:uncharacterized membrane protein YkvA (DUF1232 family)
MPKAPARRPPLLQSSDFTSYLNEKCAQMAPGDVKTLLAQAKAIRARAAELGAQRPRMRLQVDFALTLVEEHWAGRCPQIPYYTVAMLSVALLYFSDPLDVIPDWIPTVGTTDDAVVFELAFDLARAGIERYCTWKGLPTAELLRPPRRPPEKPKARRPAAAPTKARKSRR